MMFWMDSKVFQNVFLVNERDQDILKAQYVLVSTRIRKRDHKDNIISANSILFPNAHVCSALTDDDFHDRYMTQCNSSKPFIATLIKGSIEEGYNIIFLCTKKENKMKYLQYLSDFIFLEFGYPVYEYKLYSSGASQLRSYKKDKILKKCNKILKEAKDTNYQKEILTEDGRKRIIKDFKSMKKSELRKNLEKRNLYQEGMSKKDMIEMMETFM